MRVVTAMAGALLALSTPAWAGPIVSGGYSFGVALDDDGVVHTWGDNAEGQLGDGTGVPRTFPAAISLPTIVTLDAEGGQVLAVDEDGNVWSWGDNTWGQLGVGDQDDHHVPVMVPGLVDIVEVAAGERFGLALDATGSVWAWGNNEHGSLGDGTNTDRLTPVLVSGLQGVEAIAAGFLHAVAVKGDRTVWTWGLDSLDQLGLGTAAGGSIVSQNTPQQVVSMTDVVQVAANRASSMAVRADGSLWVWGHDGSGSLGLGMIALDVAVPTQLVALSDVVRVSMGISHTTALTADGTVWGWGRNALGAVGDGTQDTRFEPVMVLGVDDGVAIGAGGLGSYAVRASGEVWSWGGNANGEGGIGSTVAVQPTPNPTGLFLFSLPDLAWWSDCDGDGHVAAEAVLAPTQPECPGGGGVWTEAGPGADCDDQAPESFPGAVEWAQDGIDQSCDGTDGFVTLLQPTADAATTLMTFSGLAPGQLWLAASVQGIGAGPCIPGTAACLQLISPAFVRSWTGPAGAWSATPGVVVDLLSLPPWLVGTDIVVQPALLREDGGYELGPALPLP